MSASNKKKLRHEQQSGMLSEKQQLAAKEAQQTKRYTIAFVVMIAVILVAAIVIGVNQTIASSGIREKKTVALEVGSHKINTVEMNYFYMDAVNNFNSNYGSYAAMFGLDTTKPLDQQMLDEEAGTTWADNFLESAAVNAQQVYALVDAAKAEGYTIPQDAQLQVENNLNTLQLYSGMAGYSNVDDYVKAMFGAGSDLAGYRAYCENVALASAYRQAHADALSFTAEEIAAKDAEAPAAYTSFSYNSYYLAASRFLEGGTTAEDGSTTYSDEEKAASVAAAEEAAKALAASADAQELDAAIAALPINAGSEVASTVNTDASFASVPSSYAQWLSSADRKAGDIGYFANVTPGAEGEEDTVNGYYVVIFNGSNDNTFPLVNARHILVSFQGGTTEDGVTTYTDEEKATAKASAEELLTQWQDGEATEDSFAALANEKSNDGDGTTGGLYENIRPGQMVEAFNDWCFDAARKSGDTGIVETQYGYHVMYFVGNADISYRNYQITEELRTAAMNDWFTALVDAMPYTMGDTKYMRTDLILNSGR